MSLIGYAVQVTREDSVAHVILATSESAFQKWLAEGESLCDTGKALLKPSTHQHERSVLGLRRASEDTPLLVHGQRLAQPSSTLRSLATSQGRMPATSSQM